jgi:holo-[acyl-carrier protein] synthase
MDIGVDIVEISRIRTLYERYGMRFLKKLLTDAEIVQCLVKPDPASSIAGRFAAKEAVAKALGTGLTGEVQLRSIEVLNDQAGRPMVTLYTTGADRLRVRLSISHDRRSAVAVAVIESH